MDRKQAFQQLKRPCLDLLQVTSVLAQRPGKRNELVAALTHLLDTLRSITSNSNSLDPKLAEYAFVPISQVLRLSQLVPVRALELSLECISKLLTQGWGGSIEPALSAQLLILFTFLAKASSAGSGIAGTSEELQSLALRCMTELLQEISRSQHRDEITSTANIPALGEAVLVILDNLVGNKSNGVRLQATSALKAMIDAIKDDDALASFLPRMVSSITKVLSPSSSNRPSFRVVEKGLDVLSLLISRLLSDNVTKGLPEIVQPAKSDVTAQITRSVSWLQATASQIKIAFANVFRLRDHDKVEVRMALLKLCLLVVQECRKSLSLCTGMAIETTIGLAGREDQGSIEPELKTVLASDPKLVDVLRESLHGWILSLPRIMQSKDDHSRRLIIHQISVTMRLLEHETDFVNERLADSLRDGVSAIFSDSRGLEELPEALSKDDLTQDLALSSSVVSQFPQLALRLKGQDDIMSEFKQLIQELAKSESSVFILQDLVRSIDFGNREMRLASFWVSVNLLRDIIDTSASFDDFIDMGSPSPREELLDDLYSQSITLLNQQVHTMDLSWHFYALALETVALQASRYRSEFRAELSEVLYPVLHHLGNSNDALRSHAMTCLNMIATYCGYSNAGDLIVANVDYIVNAVGLKLAAGDISPQAPQVLLMMIRLCGPSILPYLDDLVASIFDALERYHGYPKLTELLFSVLQGMTEEGVKAPQLAITSGHEAIQQRQRTKKVTIADVINTVKKIESDSRRRKAQDDEDDRTPFPHRPWKEDKRPPEGSENHPQEGHDQDIAPQPEEPPPPAPRTFDMLLKISQLTQHYLTTESTSLRTSLLSLLKTTIPALAKHENSFLPLINTLWPVLLPRLQDVEAYIVSNALDTISLLCEHAGDFMRNRIDDAWDVLRKVHRRTQKRETGRIKTSLQMPRRLGGIEDTMSDLSISSRTLSRPEMYVDAPSRMIWNSLVGLLCSIARHVHVRDERFDEMLQILEPVLDKAEVKEAMDMGNADAVWLKLYEKRKMAGVKDGQNEDSRSLKVPQGRPHWNFVHV